MENEEILLSVQAVAVDHGVKITDDWRMLKNGREFCNVLPLPLRDKTIYGLSEKRREIELNVFKNGEMLENSVSCSAEKINTTLIQEIEKNYGLDAVISSIKSDRSMVADIAKKCNFLLEKTEVYDYTGWLSKNGFQAYNAGQNIISHLEDIDGIEVELTDKFKNRFAIDNRYYNSKKAFEFTREMLSVADESITLPLMLNSILSVVNTPLRAHGLKPSLIFWVYGTTGNLKTSLAKVYANFCKEDKESIGANLFDTTTSLEHHVSLHRDLPLLIDDLYDAGSIDGQAHLNDNSSFIIRLVSNGQGKSRMTREFELEKEMKSEGNVIFTSEMMIETASTMARIFVLETSEGSIDSGRLREVQKYQFKYSKFMSDFIKHFALNYDWKVSTSVKYFNMRREEIGKAKIHLRIIEQILHLEIAMKLYLEYGLDKGYLSLKKSKKLENQLREVIKNYLIKIRKLMAFENPIFQYFSTLEDLIESNQYALTPYKNSKQKRNHIGWEDKDYYYLNARIAYQAVKKYYSSLKKSYPLNLRDVHRMLHLEGLIVTTSDGAGIDYTVKVSPTSSNSKRVRVLKVCKESLAEYVTDLEEDHDVDKYLFSSIIDQKYWNKEINKLENNKSKKIKESIDFFFNDDTFARMYYRQKSM